MANMGPVEFYFRHLLARQGHDTSGRLGEIRAPTLILVGEDDRNVTSDMNHRTSSEILKNGITGSRAGGAAVENGTAISSPTRTRPTASYGIFWGMS